MRTEKLTLLSAVTASGAGSAVDASDYEHLSIFTIGADTFDATVAIQVSEDGTNYANLDSTVHSSNGTTLIQKQGAWNHLRANVTAYTTGTITVTVIAGSTR